MMRIALIGCSKSKKVIGPADWVPAQELYTSDLFQNRVEHVTSRQLPWYILSAKSGVIAPTTMVRSYDQTLRDMSEFEVAEWHAGVVVQLLDKLYYDHKSPSLKAVTVEIHAGARYVQPLEQLLKVLGVRVELPVKGKGIGEQLAFYKKTKDSAPA